MEQPLPEWRDMYKLFIDLGADAVIASHPHVPQGWEIYKGKPICYSLGNFCFEWMKKQPTPELWYESLCCSLDITAPHQATMCIRPVIFRQEDGYICDNDSNDFFNYLKRINNVLANEEAYMSYVNGFVEKMLSFYTGQFSRGGWIVKVFSKGFMKGLAEGLLGKGFFSIHHALNNIQCESHRWAILRALNLKKK